MILYFKHKLMAYNYELGLGHGIKDCYPLFNTVCGRVDMVDPYLTMTQRWILSDFINSSAT